MQALGIHAVVNIIIYIVFVGISFQVVKNVDVSKFMKPGHIFESQVLLLLFAIGLGYIVGSFFIAFIDTSMQLSNLF
ncbi:DUF1146 family protein [Lactobacillus corticis]|uniref:Membrane protein n=1 Tax=Lactobacillus corticis TaxID=2201249 RepID=A0A916QJU1_9LACO|nr:DUF1146 family protein [Lactobacillus corticis]GFZ27102.1 membrane protein [Lactobacillus corticis]